MISVPTLRTMHFWNNLWAPVVTQRSATDKNYFHVGDESAETEKTPNSMVATERSIRKEERRMSLN